MNSADFKAFAIEYTQTNGLYDLGGGLLYSAGRTVAPGRYMILGYNPGGDEGATVGNSLQRFDIEHNSYIDEEWAPGGVVYPAGMSPFQVQVKAIFDAVGVPLRDVCAANVVFARSRREVDLAGAADMQRLCWPVIEKMIDVVRPESILCINRSTTEVLLSRLPGFRPKDDVAAGHSNWKCRLYERTSSSSPTRLVEVPGLGVYKQIAAGKVPHVVTWIADALRGTDGTGRSAPAKEGLSA